MEDWVMIDYLRRDMLTNIVPLKMLTAYGKDMQGYYAAEGEQAGALLLLPTQVSSYDRKTYPNTDYVALLSGNEPAVLQKLLVHLPRGCKVVFKLVNDRQLAAVQAAFPVRRITSFVSFTSRPGDRFKRYPGVQAAEWVQPGLYEMFAAQGHSREEVEPYFGSGGGLSYALYGDGVPLAACFAYCNYGRVYEIGGVYTRPEERRKGYARQVVETAIDVVVEKGLIPRYQVHEKNEASIRLAETVGLVRFLTTEHWLMEK